MDTTNLNSKMYLAAALIIGLLAGFGAGLYFSGGSKSLPLLAENQKLKSQIEKAQKLFPSQPEMMFLSGTVKKVEGSIITVETAASYNPFEELPMLRKISLKEGAKIMKQELKDSAVYQKEWQNYQQKMQGTVAKPAGAVPAGSYTPPPMPYNEKEIKIGEIKEGDRINVQAAENIKFKESFEVTMIMVTGSGPAGGVPAGVAAPVLPPAGNVAPPIAPAVPAAPPVLPSAPILP